MDDLPPGYDKWRTTDPRLEAPAWEATATVTLSLNDAGDAQQVIDLMQAKGFDFEEREENPELPGQPWLVFTLPVEDHPEDFEHRLKTDTIGPEIMAMVGACEIEHDLPDLEAPEPDRDDYDLGL